MVDAVEEIGGNAEGVDSEAGKQEIELDALLNELEDEDEKETKAQAKGSGSESDQLTPEEKAAQKVYKLLGLAEMGLMKRYPFLNLNVRGVDGEGQEIEVPVRNQLTAAYTPVALDLGLDEGELPAWAEKLVMYGAAALVTFDCVSMIREQVKYHNAKQVSEPNQTEQEPEKEPEQEPETTGNNRHPDSGVLKAEPIGG